ncbi:MAG: hypothetical protein I8H94_03185 [Rhodobacteraceae bacterium]|nr:hypothetical protein [Paracoccaceae bacterium]
MTISKDLYLAILSMDSYNRGYGAGIADGGENDPDGLGLGGSIGAASIKTLDELGVTVSDYAAWQAAGFYAVAYDDPTYGRIISYRGTDNPSIYASDV